MTDYRFSRSTWSAAAAINADTPTGPRRRQYFIIIVFFLAIIYRVVIEEQNIQKDCPRLHFHY